MRFCSFGMHVTSHLHANFPVSRRRLIGARATQLLGLFAAVATASETFAQNRIGTGEAAELYRQHCAVCHGADLRGGLGSSLVDGQWAHITDDASMAAVIRNGLPDLDMQAFNDKLSDAQIRSLVIYLKEVKLQVDLETNETYWAKAGSSFKSKHHAFRLEEVCESDGRFWAMDALPDGRMILTEIDGHVRTLDPATGTLSRPIKGTPKIWRHGQGGLLEVAVHPDHAENGWIYLAFAESSTTPEDKQAGMTAIVRGRIKDGRWTEEESIFRVPSEFHRGAGVHFGTRIVFDGGYLFFGIGDRGSQDMAQDLSRPNGKIHRIHDDGRIPKDNPFSRQPDAYPTIWCYGNRNPQGLDRHPVTGALWETEHGPRGGDEINVIERGKNYGWPVITYGMNYGGTPITSETHREGMEQPAHHWTPSIAVCGIDFYEGSRFPEWKNDLMVTGLSAEVLQRVRTVDGKVTEVETLLRGQDRVRDAFSAPDGYLYVLLEKRNGKGRVMRLVPERTLDKETAE